MRTLTTGLLAVLCLPLLAVPASADGRFADDDDNVHESAIEAIADAGITLGCNPPENDRFCPDDPVTRAQMATFLDRLLGLDPTHIDHYVDDDGNVHEGSIDRMARSGITAGCNPPENDRFCPDDPVTRAQMATFLSRALGLEPEPTDRFIDDDGNVHESSINRMARSGITAGCNPPENDRYCPNDPVTRAQMATFLVRAADLVPTEPPPEPPPANEPPTAQDDSYDTLQAVPVTMTSPGVLANDSDPDYDPLTAVLVSGSNDGTLTLQASGGFTYTPDPTFIGIDTFTYRASDGEDLSDVATVTIEVAENIVTAADDSYTTAFATTLRVGPTGIEPGVAVSGTVLTNDVGGVGTVETTVVDGVDNGLFDLATDGTFTYTPEFGFTGTDTFTYEASDGLTSDQATVSISVESTRIVYIDGDATAPPSPEYLGTLAHPYTSALDVLDPPDVSQPGDIVFFFAASDPYATAIRPKADQTLVGEAVGLEVDGLDIVDPGPRPLLDTRIELATDTSVTGLTARAALAENEFGTVSLTDVELTGVGVPTLQAIGTGTVLVDATSTIGTPEAALPAVEFGANVGATIHATVEGGIELNSTTDPVTFTGPVEATGQTPDASCVSIVGPTAPVTLSGGGTLENCATGINVQSIGADITVAGTWTINDLGTGILVQGAPDGTEVSFGPEVSLDGNTTGLSLVGVDGNLTMAGSLSDSNGATNTVRVASSDGIIDISGPVSSEGADTAIEIRASSGDITFSGGGSIVDAANWGVSIHDVVTGGSVTFSGDWTFDGNGVDPVDPVHAAAIFHRPQGPILLTLGSGVEITNSPNVGINLAFGGGLIMDGTITHTGDAAAIHASSHTGDVTVNGTITGGKVVEVGGTGGYLFTGAITATDPGAGTSAIRLTGGNHTFTAPVTVTGTGSGVSALGSGTVSFESLDVNTTLGALSLTQVSSFQVTDTTGTLSSSAGTVLNLNDVGLTQEVFPFASLTAGLPTGFTGAFINNVAIPLTIQNLSITHLAGLSPTGVSITNADVTLEGAAFSVTGSPLAGEAITVADANVTISDGSFASPIVLSNTSGEQLWTLTDNVITGGVQAVATGGTACLDATGNDLETGEIDLEEAGGEISISQADLATLESDNGATATVTGTIDFNCTN